MKLEIENKRKFAMFVLVLAILIIGGAVYYFTTTKKNTINNLQPKNKIVPTETRKEEIIFAEYKNQRYNYLVKYPTSWHVSASEAESELVASDPESGIDYPLGGQVFWSNYANIDDYSPEDKPDNFRLLGLAIYQGNEETASDFAKKIGVSEDSVEADFKTDGNLTGSQFVFAGQAENDFQITVILRKENLFYVFRTAFINGDEQAAENMQNIIKSFTFQP